MGSTSDVQALKELFTNVIAANKILLNTDNFPYAPAGRSIERLPAYKTNALGCLLRWQHAYQEEDVRLRNIPHLYALYPGTEFTENTPDMLTACHRTLERQGGASTAWQMAWNVNLYARLGDGESAYKTLQELRSPALEESISPYPARDTASVTLLTPGTYPNGFSSNPHFQLAGNLGGCAGIAEMLLQCHQGFIHVLPALPAAWQEKALFPDCVSAEEAKSHAAGSRDWLKKSCSKHKQTTRSPSKFLLISGT